ncbi:hypothetical protein GGR51DRAFT_562651 [Nemania sp. FL0031]|nr:hypothetical protein GGR51DRAFT_562651 [Nemania sp. FL0031]
MTSQPDHQTTTGDPVASTSATFLLFPALPPELRVQIWRLTLRPRIINLHLHPRQATNYILKKKWLTRPRESRDDRFEVVIDSYRAISKLFRVNKESRYEAQLFYERRLPCWFVGVSNELEPGILYYKLNHDSFYITPHALFAREYPLTPTHLLPADRELCHDALEGFIMTPRRIKKLAARNSDFTVVLRETLLQFREMMLAYAQSSLCELGGPNQHLFEPTYKPTVEGTAYTGLFSAGRAEDDCEIPGSTNGNPRHE